MQYVCPFGKISQYEAPRRQGSPVLMALLAELVTSFVRYRRAQMQCDCMSGVVEGSGLILTNWGSLTWTTTQAHRRYCILPPSKYGRRISCVYPVASVASVLPS